MLRPLQIARLFVREQALQSHVGGVLNDTLSMEQGTSNRLPAEWEPQSGVMLTWPHEGSDWGRHLESVHALVAEIGAAITKRQALLSVCRSSRHIDPIRHLLAVAGASMDQALSCVADSNDSWARDHGPLTALHGDAPVLNDFIFDGWGGRFDSYLDSAVTQELYRQKVFGDATIQHRDLVLEGGAIETDGQGTLLATRSSILSRKRNPAMNRTTIERRLGDWLGLERILWLEHGRLDGDDTDNHIDTLARFSDPNTILYASAPRGDTDHAELAAMARQLRTFRSIEGRPYRLLPLPFPGVHRDASGRRLPASYANFLIINGAVLLPAYGVSQDDEAVALLSSVFPTREIVALDCRPLIQQNGSLHCLTMHFPLQLELRDTLQSGPGSRQASRYQTSCE